MLRSNPAPNISCASAVAAPLLAQIRNRSLGAVILRSRKDYERAGNIKWVILRPGLFTQNVLPARALIKTENKLAVNYAFAKDRPVDLIDVRDTGAVGARILTDRAPHAGKTNEFTGALTTYDEFADVFSQVLGRKITYAEKTLEQSEQLLKARSMPNWLIAQSEHRSRPSSSSWAAWRFLSRRCSLPLQAGVSYFPAFPRMSTMNYPRGLRSLSNRNANAAGDTKNSYQLGKITTR
jgi:hypothetical protein